jgi:plastocyanin
MKLYLITLAAMAAVSAQNLSAAELSGKVTLKGTPPPETKIATMDPTCGKLNNNQLPTTRHYVTSSDGGLANVWVFIKNPPAGKAPAAGQPVVLDQLNCMYQPYVMGISTGQKLIVRNSDPVLHNVNTTASAVPSHRFNIAQPIKGKEDAKTFEKPELPLKFMCNVHNWMFAYAGIFDHPYYAVTDKDGKFKLPDLPPGKYTVVAKHLKAGEATQEITVDGNKTVDFALQVPAAAK